MTVQGTGSKGLISGDWAQDAALRAIESQGEQESSDYVRRRRWRDFRRKFIRGLIALIAVFVLWHLTSVYYNLQLILPPPLPVLQNVLDTILLDRQTPWLYGANIYEHLRNSSLRALTGFGIATLLAVPLGLLTGRFQTVREFIEPIVKTLYPIPGIAWIPLAILWFGLGNHAVVFVVFMYCFFPMYFSTEAGVRNIHPLLIDAARCFGARGFTLFLRVILPASVPFIVTGLRIALGGAWRMIVAGEMLASETGIGFLLMEARFQFRATDLMMAMILISIVGYATEKLIVGTIERRTIRKWEVK
jgi:ABC-type nitrate/sulfonate/bicarbonate transport system permease component